MAPSEVRQLVAERSYPRSIDARGRSLELRAMGEGDVDRIVGFARSLLEEDLLFLPLDISRPEVVSGWAESIASGETFTVLALDDGSVAGYGSLSRPPTQWSRHLAEIRLNVGVDHRGIGLGGVLADEIIDVARSSGLRKIIAQMPRDQEAARAVFRKLGFDLESMLADWVIDTDGATHDLVVMARTVGT